MVIVHVTSNNIIIILRKEYIFLVFVTNNLLVHPCHFHWKIHKQIFSWVRQYEFGQLTAIVPDLSDK